MGIINLFATYNLAKNVLNAINMGRDPLLLEYLNQATYTKKVLLRLTSLSFTGLLQYRKGQSNQYVDFMEVENSLCWFPFTQDIINLTLNTKMFLIIFGYG